MTLLLDGKLLLPAPTSALLHFDTRLIYWKDCILLFGVMFFLIISFPQMPLLTLLRMLRVYAYHLPTCYILAGVTLPLCGHSVLRVVAVLLWPWSLAFWRLADAISPHIKYKSVDVLQHFYVLFCSGKASGNQSDCIGNRNVCISKTGTTLY